MIKDFFQELTAGGIPNYNINITMCNTILAIDKTIQCSPSQTKPEQYCSSSMYFKFDMQRGQCATGPCMSVRHQQKFHAISLFTHIIYIYIIHCNQLPAFICLKSKTKKHSKPSKPGTSSPEAWPYQTLIPFLRPFSKVLKFYSSILPTLPPPQPFHKGKGVVRSHKVSTSQPRKPRA